MELPRRAAGRALKDGKLNFYWVMCNNKLQAGPNMNEEAAGYRNPANFICGLRPLSDRDRQAADLILPHRHVGGEGAYGNAERRTQFWHQQVKAPEGAKSDLWQMMKFSKRFTVEEVWPAELIKAGSEGQDPVRRALCQRR